VVFRNNEMPICSQVLCSPGQSLTRNTIASQNTGISNDSPLLQSHSKKELFSSNNITAQEQERQENVEN